MPTQLNLNNKSNTLSINVTQADNLIAVYLNPDSANKGMVKVYEMHQADMGVTFNATIDLTNYLHQFRLINPASTTIELVVCMSNFAGGGAYHYTLSGSIPVHTESGNIAVWSSKMDSYIVKIYP